MEFIISLLNIVISFFSFVLILRAWLEFCRVSPQLPISQSLLRLTQPLVNPVSKVIPNLRGNINVAAILIAIVIVTLFYFFFIDTISITTAVLIGLLSVLKTFGQILFFTTLIRALMSWVTQGNHPLDYTVAQITEPVLGLIRRFLPKTGMLDFSVMVLAFILLALNQFLYSHLGGLWAIA
ncbi:MULTISPECIES: YggT family protein [Pasteurellaceae]|uniref:YggT family protein n=1 Tax=Pasteurella atlantica TaxID=2827233 RepID=A0AAW8CIT0_9PAST|nr:YggT family protein [Pasteurella atlantica]MBR0574054.1 YggT family protein [Pasteurella atlantica]MDP8040016.1 YggT family protein [Pasteurella atlantica]MDP8042130.1 YggT family protein [Pasteurella atlantica]MDP8044234.1 YggT family protein [Pasteurella atlantica]MDP8046329.1 YggT family protein [Pasteurella atlantica]